MIFTYALAIFASAFLLFMVQPLLGKYLLPWFGGGTGVWTACLLTFQFLLLAGYSYVYFLTRKFELRSQVIVHSLLLLAALFFLPAVPGEDGSAVLKGDPILQIVSILLSSIGLPFIVLAASSPLLQSWFSTAFPDRSPYPLYSISNLGSMLALLSYPFLFEPILSRANQSLFWTVSFFIYTAAVGAIVFALKREGRLSRDSDQVEKARGSPDKGGGWDWFFWVMFPALASALLLATTNRVCQDIAVVPFLWVLPLALYILSFVLVFQSHRLYSRVLFGLALLLAVFANYYLLSNWEKLATETQIAGYSVILFIGAMASHGETVRLKPHPRRLPSFYLALALGGALGSLFVAVGGPLFFEDFLEFELIVIALCVLYLIRLLVDESSFIGNGKPVWASSILIAVLLFSSLTLLGEKADKDPEIIARWRNFYGTLTLGDRSSEHEQFHHYTLRHGRIAHGLQLRDPERRYLPTSYYGNDSGVGLAIQALPGERHRIGVIGLGVGTLATYGEEGDLIRFYEINPLVEDVAREYFTYLEDSEAEIEVVVGDARVQLQKEAQNDFDLLVMDAFSGDAVPVHLLTREAFALYLEHLEDDGVLAVHVSNRHLELRPVARAAAREFGLHFAVIHYWPEEEHWWEYSSTWVLLTASDEFKKHQAVASYFENSDIEDKPIQLWTDEYASVFNIIR